MNQLNTEAPWPPVRFHPAVLKEAAFTLCRLLVIQVARTVYGSTFGDVDDTLAAVGCTSDSDHSSQGPGAEVLRCRCVLSEDLSHLQIWASWPCPVASSAAAGGLSQARMWKPAQIHPCHLELHLHTGARGFVQALCEPCSSESPCGNGPPLELLAQEWSSEDLPPEWDDVDPGIIAFRRLRDIMPLALGVDLVARSFPAGVRSQQLHVC